MMATVMNALALKDAFETFGHQSARTIRTVYAANR